jgi:hypothetical protein
VVGIDDEHLKQTLQQVVHRSPEKRGAFHGDVRTTHRLQPVDKRQQFLGHRGAGTDLVLDVSVCARVHETGHHEFLVDVQPAAGWIDDLHQAPPQDNQNAPPHQRDVRFLRYSPACCPTCGRNIS